MRRKRVIFGLTAVGLTAAAASAQESGNMVYNASFEDYVRCPDKIEALGKMTEVEAWWQPTEGSSDYFNACGGRETSVPRNKMGVQEAHSGVAYCGIYCSQEHYREYLQTELRSPLKAGCVYEVSFWVSLADKSPHAVATVGALLTSERLEAPSHDILRQRTETHLQGGGTQVISTAVMPQVVSDSLLADTKHWQRVSGRVVAVGGERFLTIGNFSSFNASAVTPTGNGNAVLQGAYYYVDDVSVVCLGCEGDTSAVGSDSVALDTNYRSGDVVTLNGVFFDTDKSEVLPQSYNDLKHLLDVLLSHEGMVIEIRGHTDNQGTMAHNQNLSEARARAVADYLVRHGVDERRLRCRGFGSTQPVADNSSVEGRAANRRVEYCILSL